MIVKVNARQLNSLFADYVKGKKELFCFMFSKSVITVQYLSVYTAETSLSILTDNIEEDKFNITFYATKSILALNDNEDVTIDANEETITFKQGKTSITYMKEYELPKELPDLNEIEFTKISSGRLKYLSHMASQFTSIAKELKVYASDPTFIDNYFYVGYQNCAFFDSFEFPTCCLSVNTMRSVIFKFGDNVQYAYVKDKELLIFATKKYVFYLPTNNTTINRADISADVHSVDSMQPVTKINVKSYVEDINRITSIFDKTLLLLAFGNGQMSIVHDDIASYVHTGSNIERALCSLKVSTGQLGIISKIFGEDEEVEVLKGVNVLCLRARTKNLLIAGVIY